MNTRFLAVMFAMLVTAFSAPDVRAQAFTYQGRLDQAGVPANGAFDFQFALFSAAAGGTQIGLATQRNAEPVTSGVFTVYLSFAAAFTGPDRFLEVRVRPAGVGGFTTLTPRQPLTPAPYAIKALTENFFKPDAVTLTNDPTTTRLFLNRQTPIMTNEVFGVTIPTGAVSGGVTINHADATGTPQLSFAQAGTQRATISYSGMSPAFRVSIPGSPVNALTVTTTGLGVNLATMPAEALEVGGDAAANNFVYRAPFARSLTVPPEAFKPELTTQNGQFGSSLAFLNSGETGQINAPVYLPDGAVVTGITAILIDNSAAVEMSVLLLGRNVINTTYFVVAGVSSTGNNINPRSFTASGGTDVIDTIPYVVRVTITGGNWAGASTAVKAVRIDYTVAQPD